MQEELLKQLWPEWKIIEKPLKMDAQHTIYRALWKAEDAEHNGVLKVIRIPADSLERDRLYTEGFDINAQGTYIYEIVNDFVKEVHLMGFLKDTRSLVSVEDYKIVEMKNKEGIYICIRIELLPLRVSYVYNKNIMDEAREEACTSLQKYEKQNIIYYDNSPKVIVNLDNAEFEKIERLDAGRKGLKKTWKILAVSAVAGILILGVSAMGVSWWLQDIAADQNHSTADSGAEDEDSAGYGVENDAVSNETYIEEYEKLKEQVKQTTLEDAASLAKSGDYIAAMNLIQYAQQTYGDNSDYRNAYTTYKNAYSAVLMSQRTTAILSADEAAAGEDYLGAVQILQELMKLVGEDAELREKIQTYENTYVQKAAEEIRAYLDEENHEAATEVLNIALKNFPENEVLLECKTDVNDRKAKSLLLDCPPYQTEGYYTEKTYSIMGELYANGFHLNDDRGGIAYFNLKKKYSTLRFDVGHIDGKQLKTGYYYVYLDGVLAHTLVFEPSMQMEHIEIDLEGVSQLVIEGGSWCHCFALVNVSVCE